MNETKSVCPVCLRVLEAKRIKRGNKTYLERTCPEHGNFSALVWDGDYEAWGEKHAPVAPIAPAHPAVKGCPFDCGLCPAHEQKTCCVLLEVTMRCNLRCPVCFASAGSGKDMPMEEIEQCLDDMLKMGGPFNIQLSGGEPTMRNDLEQIIRKGKQKGFPFFQLNTNGLRIAEEDGYIEKLAGAGLDCVFLQYDGEMEETYQKLRGQALLRIKKQAIRRCGNAGIGVVLVPTVACGVNDGEVGAVLDYALSMIPTVRGVHFQPLSRFGRCELDAPRYTLDMLMRAIETQTNGRMKASDFSSGNAENAHCSFSANFILNEDGTLSQWGRKGCGCASACCDSENAARARKFVAKRWSAARPAKRTDSPYVKADALDAFLDRVERGTLAVSAMAFMDAETLDLSRLRQCYIHVVRVREGKTELIPFCAYNLTAADGHTLYRDMNS